MPAVFGDNAVEDAEKLAAAVRESGKVYAMFETSAFHADCHEMRMRYRAGAYGRILYAEGEYHHRGSAELPGYNPVTRKIDTEGWRKGIPPMWYPTHATAYYVGVTGHRLTHVSCVGTPSSAPNLQADTNPYGNPFGTEVALFKTSEGGSARMSISWDMYAKYGETGRVFGEKSGHVKGVDLRRPPIPPATRGGGHGGSHGYLTNDFIEAILLDRSPVVGVTEALDMTVAGIVAHTSALKDGEWLSVPRYGT